MVGITEVKEKLKSYSRLMQFNQRRLELGLPVLPISLHSLFIGSPGTGKTTIVKHLGKLLQKAGVLSKGHVVFRERANLIGQFYSSEGENIIKAIDEAQGGILFIDEAYQLHQPSDPKDPGKFVLESLMTALADESRRDWMLVLAGYTEPMLKMLELNPGLKSRIPETNHFHFHDFSADELMEIAKRYFNKMKFSIEEEAEKQLQLRINRDFARRDKNFGNARYVMNIVQLEILPAMAERLAAINSPSPEDLSTIRYADIQMPQTTFNGSPRIGFR